MEVRGYKINTGDTTDGNYLAPYCITSAQIRGYCSHFSVSKTESFTGWT